MKIGQLAFFKKKIALKHLKKAKYNTDKDSLNKTETVENEVPDASRVGTNTALNTKVIEIEKEIADTKGLVTNTALNKKLMKLKKKTT